MNKQQGGSGSQDQVQGILVVDMKGATTANERKSSPEVVEDPAEDQSMGMEAMEGIKKSVERGLDNGGEGLILTHVVL